MLALCQKGQIQKGNRGKRSGARRAVWTSTPPPIGTGDKCTLSFFSLARLGGFEESIGAARQRFATLKFLNVHRSLGRDARNATKSFLFRGRCILIVQSSEIRLQGRKTCQVTCEADEKQHMRYDVPHVEAEMLRSCLRGCKMCRIGMWNKHYFSVTSAIYFAVVRDTRSQQHDDAEVPD